MSSTSFAELSDIRLGILGGGQLGKMLVKAASQWSVHTSVLDPSSHCPSFPVCNNFVKGDFKNYEDVYAFGKQVDVIAIEIENVNTDALIELEKEGKLVFPQPSILNIIKDKGLQKQFYSEHGFASPKFIFYNNKAEIITAVQQNNQFFPFVQKLRKAGYDGKGVAVVRTKDDLEKLLDGECIVEEMVDIQKEISVIVARNRDGEISSYAPVEMTFNPEANLVEYLICPAQIGDDVSQAACELAGSIIKKLGLTGILAVEMFLDKNNKLLINEVAPRPHNSGHQTIEGAGTSQYEQYLRAIFGLPLGSTKLITPSIMINFLGAPGHKGKPKYEGLKECMKIEGVNIHLYGKKETRPYRKMGHATIIDTSIESAKNKAIYIQQHFKIKS